MRLKYIITEHGNFALFTEGLKTHQEMAQHPIFGEVVGAGFATIGHNPDTKEVNVHCFGESVSLGIKSREEDEKNINDKLNGYEL